MKRHRCPDRNHRCQAPLLDSVASGLHPGFRVAQDRVPQAPAGAGIPWRRFRPLAIMLAVVLVAAALYVAKAIVAPIVFAVLLASLLSPLVRAAERLVPRILAVLLVVAVTCAVVGTIAWALSTQLASLADELPKYRHNIVHRIEALRGATAGGPIEKIESTARDVMRAVDGKSAERGPSAQPVVVREPRARSLWTLPSAIGPLLDGIATAGLVIALMIFVLVRRSELRNRVVSLLGPGRLSLATKAIDEATDRVSRYLLSYTIVNAALGTAIGTGLLLMGVPYAVLFGVLAGVLRFIPYVGVWSAAVVTVTFSLAAFPGWTQPLMVAGLFVVLEPLVALGIEPLVYSHRVGVSDVALLVAVAFWTWLWGPVGLVLAVPLTVCLVVVGRYVPELEFITVLLGDETAEAADLACYQRLLARDADEAADIAEAYAATHAGVEVFDAVLLPALGHAAWDRGRDRIDDDDLRFIVDTAAEIVEALDLPTPPSVAPAGAPVRVLGCPVRSQADEVAFRMLARALDPGWSLDVAAPDMLASEVVSQVTERRPVVICVGSITPGELAHTRYLVKRLRARLPSTAIVVGRWGAHDTATVEAEGLRAAGADRVASTLAETLAALRTVAAGPVSTGARPNAA